ESMADVAWKTLENYGLTDKIIAFVMDNATNNDIMVEAIQAKCLAAGIRFEARKARMRCMPHTVHLAALKLFEAIGALTKEDSKKAQGRSKAAYQEEVTHLNTKAADCDAALRVDDDEEDKATEPQMETISWLQRTGAALAVFKLRKIVKHVRSSPQRCRSWQHTVRVTSDRLDAELEKAELMLILDVRTRRTPTHQMLRKLSARQKVLANSYQGAQFIILMR
ncbi:hypothetical protein DFH08DRAFT_724785, partial [Mycena albidolilacea]